MAFGGHYLSDVLLGGLVTLIVIEIARRLLWPRTGVEAEETHRESETHNGAKLADAALHADGPAPEPQPRPFHRSSGGPLLRCAGEDDPSAAAFLPCVCQGGGMGPRHGAWVEHDAPWRGVL